MNITSMSTPSLTSMRNAVYNEMYITAGALTKAGFDVKKPLNNEGFNSASDECDIDFLVSHIIKTHHTFAKKNVVIIYNLMQRVAYHSSGQHPALQKFIEVAFCFFQDLLNQMLKEEQYLFPYIRQTIKERNYDNKTVNSDVKTLIEKIELQKNQHEKSLNYLKVFREITNGYQVPDDACWHYNSLFKKMKALEHDLTRHFHLEDDILFYNAIAACMQSEKRQPYNDQAVPSMEEV